MIAICFNSICLTLKCSLNHDDIFQNNEDQNLWNREEVSYVDGRPTLGKKYATIFVQYVQK